MNLLTQKRTEKAVGLSGRTLERHRQAGTGPKFVKLGRRVFYRPEDLDEWIAECISRSTSEADAKAACQKQARPANSSRPRTRAATTGRQVE